MAEERAKFSIIDGAKYSLEQVQSAVSYNEERALEVQQPEVQKFLSYWDQVFLYGLKSVKKGYWPFVSKLSHPSLTRAVLSTPGAVNDLTRSRIWLASILNENSLECYLVIISTEFKLLNKFYRPNAILRTSAIVQDLISISCGSENTLFSIHMDYICYHSTEIFINSKSENELKVFDTGLTLDRLEARSRSCSNVSIVSNRSTFSFKSPFESSRARITSLAAELKSPGRYPFVRSDSDEISIGIEAELIDSPDSIAECCEFGGDVCNEEDEEKVEVTQEDDNAKEEKRIEEERTEKEDKGDDKDKRGEKDKIEEKIMKTEGTSLCETDRIDESELKERKWSVDYQQSDQLIESMIIQEKGAEMPSFLFDDVDGTPKSSPELPEITASLDPQISASSDPPQISASSDPPQISTSPDPIVPAITQLLQNTTSSPCTIPSKHTPTPSPSASPPKYVQSPRLDTPPNMDIFPQTPTKSIQCPQPYMSNTPIHSNTTSPIPCSPLYSLSRSRKGSGNSTPGSFTESGIMRKKTKLAKIESINVQHEDQPVTEPAEHLSDETGDLELEEKITFDWRGDNPSVVDDPDDLSALLSNLTTEADEAEREEEEKKEEEENKKKEEEKKRKEEDEKEADVKEDEVKRERNDSSEFREDVVTETITIGETSSMLSISETDQPRISPYEEEEVIIATEDILFSTDDTLLSTSPAKSESLTGSPCSYLSDIETSDIEFVTDTIVEEIPFTNLGDQGQEIIYVDENKSDPYSSDQNDTESSKELKSESDSSLDIIQPKDHSITPILETSTSNTQDQSIESEILHASIEHDKFVLPATPEEQISVRDRSVQISGRDRAVESSTPDREEERSVADRVESEEIESSKDEMAITDVIFREASQEDDGLYPDSAMRSEFSHVSDEKEKEEVSKGVENVEAGEVDQSAPLDQAHSSKDSLPADVPSDDAPSDDAPSDDAPSFDSVEMDRSQADYEPPTNLLIKFSINVFSDEEQYKRMIRIWLKDEVGNLAVGYVMLSTARTYLLDDDFSIVLSISYSSITSVLRSTNWQVLTLMFIGESGENGEIDIITGCEAISRGVMQGFMMYSTVPVTWSDEKSVSQCRLFDGVRKFIRSQAAPTESIDTDLYYVITFWEPLKGEPPPKTDYPMTQGTLGLKEPTLLSYVWRDYYFILDCGKLHQMGLQCSRDVKKIYTIIGAEGCKHMKPDETTKKFAFKFKSAEGIEVMLNCKTEESLTRWMQVLCETAMEIPRAVENMGVSGLQCSVILCQDWLMVLREGLKSVYTLSATPLCEVSLVQWYPEENFCIITIAEESREWLLLFRDAFETSKFLELLWDKWSNLFKLDDATALFRKLSNNSDSLFKAQSSMIKFKANWEEEKKDVILSF